MSELISEQEPKRDLKKEILSFIKDLIIIICAVLIVRNFFILPFQISGQSMYDSYYDKEFIIVNRLGYLTYKKPQRWDVVVFDTHMEGREYFIKRIIGLPGDTLKIAWGKVYVKAAWEEDFTQLDEAYLSETNYNATYVRWDELENIYEVPEGEYFVMGDNRNASTDSRACFSSCDIGGKTNFIKKSDITGQVWLDLGYFNFKAFAFTNPDLGIDTHPKWLSSPSNFTY